MLEYRIYREHQAIKSAGAIEKFVGEEVPEGYTLELTSMNITDITSGGQALELGIIEIGDVDRVVCMTEGANLHHHHLVGEVFLKAGEAPYGRITTAQANDYCYFFCNGKLWKIS